MRPQTYLQRRSKLTKSRKTGLSRFAVYLWAVHFHFLQVPFLSESRIFTMNSAHEYGSYVYDNNESVNPDYNGGCL